MRDKDKKQIILLWTSTDSFHW